MFKLALKSISLGIVLLVYTPVFSSGINDIELSPVYLKTTPHLEEGDTQVPTSSISKETDSLVPKKPWISPGARRLAVTAVTLGICATTVAIDLYLMKSYLSAYQEGYRLDHPFGWGTYCDQAITCKIDGNKSSCWTRNDYVANYIETVKCPDVERKGLSMALDMARNNTPQSFQSSTENSVYTYYGLSAFDPGNRFWFPIHYNRVDQGKENAWVYPYYMGMTSVISYAAILFVLYYNFSFG